MSEQKRVPVEELYDRGWSLNLWLFSFYSLCRRLNNLKSLGMNSDHIFWYFCMVHVMWYAQGLSTATGQLMLPASHRKKEEKKSGLLN